MHRIISGVGDTLLDFSRTADIMRFRIFYEI